MNDIFPHSQTPPAKRIFLICDGTSEDATQLQDEGEPAKWTNAHRFMQCVAGCDERSNMQQVKHYLSRPGTRGLPISKMTDKAAGTGKILWQVSNCCGSLTLISTATFDKIMERYRFICSNCYSHRDEIVLVGFSREGYIAKVIENCLQQDRIRSALLVSWTSRYSYVLFAGMLF